LRRTGAVISILALAVIVAAAALWLIRAPEILPLNAPPASSGFAPSLVARGAQLAAAGACNSCHTVGTRSLSGGVRFGTPFGTLYSTNITPDPRAGIGLWSETAFVRAMRMGVSRDGNQLYPVFPYDHFRLLSDADLHALYAWTMTRAPLRSEPRGNALHFPFNVRPLLKLWKLFFLKAPMQSAADSSARGIYLTEGLAHCGACHTHRNLLGAERDSDPLSGGEVDGWEAYALNGQSVAPVPWTADALFKYLHDGWDAEHGVAYGPMAAVIAELRHAAPSDVREIARAVAARMPRRAAAAPPSAAAPDRSSRGAAVFAATCVNCHDGSRTLPFGGIALQYSSAVSSPSPRNLIRLVLHGIAATDGVPSAIMPGFDGAISDEDLMSLLQYVRVQFSQRPAWGDLEQEIAGVRKAGAGEEPHRAEPGALRDGD